MNLFYLKNIFLKIIFLILLKTKKIKKCEKKAKVNHEIFLKKIEKNRKIIFQKKLESNLILI